jgi:hypothetical protein
MTEKCKHEKGKYIGSYHDVRPHWECKKCGVVLLEEEFTKKDDAPVICPLLSIGNTGQPCWKEGCTFYLSKLPTNMEKCIWVRMAISLGQIAEATKKGDLDKVMTSLKKQHRLE